jgi:hypothetical protein
MMRVCSSGRATNRRWLTVSRIVSDLQDKEAEETEQKIINEGENTGSMLRSIF